MNPHIIIAKMKLAFEKWRMEVPTQITVSPKTYDYFKMQPESEIIDGLTGDLMFDGVILKLDVTWVNYEKEYGWSK